jgi:hypothetical protein
MKTLLSIAVIVTSLVTVRAAETLVWDVSPETNLVGYVVCYGHESGNPTHSFKVGNVLSEPLTGNTNFTLYGELFITLKAEAVSGLLSDPSKEVTWTNRAFAPINLRIQGSGSVTGPWTNIVVLPVDPQDQAFYRVEVSR